MGVPRFISKPMLSLNVDNISELGIMVCAKVVWNKIIEVITAVISSDI